MSKPRIGPDDTEYTGSQNDDDGRWDTFSDATGSGDTAIHKTAEGIAEAHDPDPLHAGIDDCRFCGKQWQKLRTENKKQSTKDNLHSTLAVLNDFRSGLDFKDITYTFLRDFEQYLREKGNADNTIAKHMKQLRILVNEAINQGYMHADAYPFRN